MTLRGPLQRAALCCLLAATSLAPVAGQAAARDFDAHAAALRARLRQRSQARARQTAFSSMVVPSTPWPLGTPDAYRALLAYRATFLDPAVPLVLHDQGTWQLTLTDRGFVVTASTKSPPALQRAFEQMGIRDTAGLDAFVAGTLQRLAPRLARGQRDIAGLVKSIERAVAQHTSHVRELTSGTDASLLRTYFTQVTHKLGIHRNGIDIGQNGEIFLLNGENHITYADRNTPLSLRRASELELVRGGLFTPASFDRAVQRKLLELAEMKQERLDPDAIEQARARLSARIQEVADLETYLSDPSTHRELALLEELRTATNQHRVVLAEQPMNPHDKVTLSLQHRHNEPKARIYWQVGVADGPQLASLRHLADFKLATKPAFDALIRDKILAISPDSIPP